MNPTSKLVDLHHSERSTFSDRYRQPAFNTPPMRNSPEIILYLCWIQQHLSSFNERVGWRWEIIVHSQRVNQSAG